MRPLVLNLWMMIHPFKPTSLGWRTNKRKRGENEGSISIITVVFSFIGVTWEKKLTEDQVYEVMVELYARELSMAEIGNEFGVSKSLISQLNRGIKYPIDGYKYPIRETE